jgi:Mor family transcriptional regulator
MAGSTDDPVLRIVEAAVEAQTRLMLAYMEQMRQQVTDQVMRAMRAEMGGEQIYMGKGTASRLVERNLAMCADRANGMSIRAIAKKHRVSKSCAAVVVSDVPFKNGTVDPENDSGATGAGRR